MGVSGMCLECKGVPTKSMQDVSRTAAKKDICDGSGIRGFCRESSEERMIGTSLFLFLSFCTHLLLTARS